MLGMPSGGSVPDSKLLPSKSRFSPSKRIQCAGIVPPIRLRDRSRMASMSSLRGGFCGPW